MKILRPPIPVGAFPIRSESSVGSVAHVPDSILSGAWVGSQIGKVEVG